MTITQLNSPETLDWDKQPLGPRLPADIIRKTTEKYIEALTRLTT